jgi:hypothetical protein
MEPVGAFKGLRGPSPSGSGIISPTIPEEGFDFGMSPHPDFGRFRLAVRQEIEDLVAL